MRMFRSYDTRRHAREAGFTLVELLVVLVILGLLVGLVGPKMINYLSGAKSDTARVQIHQLVTALDLFKLDVGRYPTTEEGLRALIEKPGSVQSWRGPHLSSTTVPHDPWGFDYHYKLPGTGGKPYDLYTLGADNAVGGDGENSDISN